MAGCGREAGCAVDSLTKHGNISQSNSIIIRAIVILLTRWGTHPGVIVRALRDLLPEESRGIFGTEAEQIAIRMEVEEMVDPVQILRQISKLPQLTEMAGLVEAKRLANAYFEATGQD